MKECQGSVVWRCRWLVLHWVMQYASTDNMYSSHHKIANNTFHQQNDMADKTYLDYFKQVIYKQMTWMMWPTIVCVISSWYSRDSLIYILNYLVIYFSFIPIKQWLVVRWCIRMDGCVYENTWEWRDVFRRCQSIHMTSKPCQ